MDVQSKYLDLIRQITQERQAHPGSALHEITDLILTYQLSVLQARIVQSNGWIVQAGPFAGMQFLAQTAEGVIVPKLLGVYESELHPVLQDEVPGRSYLRVVDVGCAEGYYAVGFAHLLPATSVYAFDIDEKAQELCLALARLNHVADRVMVGGACDHSTLQELAGNQTLIFCDCEGAELNILDIERVPNLAASDILVECHDFMEGTISRRLAERFAATHEVKLIANSATNPNAIPNLRRLPPVQRFLAVWEGRPGLTPWLWMVSRSEFARE